MASLEAALRLGIGPATEGATIAPVAFVLDVSPYVRRARAEIGSALLNLRERSEGLAWRVAALGEELSSPTNDPAGLVALLRRHEGTDTVNTLRSLRRTLDGFTEPGVIVYLGDWRVEDEEGLEDLIDRLKKRRQRFMVIGSEGCFGRAWMDGFFPPHRLTTRGGLTVLYDDHVGRSPFGPENPEAPWHSGDTAWPHLPYYWEGAWWQTKFPVELPPVPANDGGYASPESESGSGAGKPEDLRERVRDVDVAALERYWFPLPSSFGPYPLMRLAAETRGRYVLWSWNRTGHTQLAYDDGRCDHYAPDLRSRATIRKDLAKRPLARALLRAWQEIANEDVRVAGITAPFAGNAKPAEMVETPGDSFLSYHWHEPQRRKELLQRAPRALSALDRALAHLQSAGSREPGDPVGRRYLADLHLLRHTLLVHRFTIGEALQAARRDVPSEAWSDPTHQPGLDPVICIPSGKDPEAVMIVDEAPVRDRALAERVRDDRRFLLERYAGTPFAELVGRNVVYTVQFNKHPYGSGAPARASPADSNTPRRRTGPGSSGRPGGTTGGQ